MDLSIKDGDAGVAGCTGLPRTGKEAFLEFIECQTRTLNAQLRRRTSQIQPNQEVSLQCPGRWVLFILEVRKRTNLPLWTLNSAKSHINIMSLIVEIKRSNVTDYAELVVRDFLQSRGYFGALEALNEDTQAAKLERKQEAEKNGEVLRYENDSVESWYIVNQHLGLPTLLNKNRTVGKGCWEIDVGKATVIFR